MGTGVPRLDPEGRAEFGDGRVPLALAGQGDAEVVVSRGVVGLELEGDLELGDGRVPLALTGQGDAQADVGQGVVGLEPEGRAILIDGCLGLRDLTVGFRHTIRRPMRTVKQTGCVVWLDEGGDDVRLVRVRCAGGQYNPEVMADPAVAGGRPPRPLLAQGDDVRGFQLLQSVAALGLAYCKG